MKRYLLVVAALAAFSGAMVGASSASAQSGDLNCPDFATQPEAQAVLDQDPSDPNGLDGAPRDGVACESLPDGNGATTPGSVTAAESSPETGAVAANTGTNAAPSGGVATGFGGMAPRSSTSNAPLGLIVPAGLVAAGSLCLLVSRRYAS